MPIQVVLDTNVWVSGLGWYGNARRCLELARTRLIQPVFSSSMIAELAETLRTKFKYSENDIRAVMYDINRVGIHVNPPNMLRGVSADPDDDKFIECAVYAQVPYLVSEDKHLLNLTQYEQVRILSVAEFLKMIDKVA